MDRMVRALTKSSGDMRAAVQRWAGSVRVRAELRGSRLRAPSENRLSFCPQTRAFMFEQTFKNIDDLTVRSNGNPELIGRCMVVGKALAPVTYSGCCLRDVNVADSTPT